GAVGPLAGEVARDQFVPDGGEPLAPVLAAARPHRLGGVVVAVEVVHVAAGGLGFNGVLLHPVGGAALDLGAVVDAGAVQGADAGRGAGERLLPGAAALGHVAEPAAEAVLAALDVGDAGIDGLFRHADAGVAGGAQGHDLADGHRDVGVG